MDLGMQNDRTSAGTFGHGILQGLRYGLNPGMTWANICKLAMLVHVQLATTVGNGVQTLFAGTTKGTNSGNGTTKCMHPA